MHEHEHLRARWLTKQGSYLRAVVIQSLRAGDEHWGEKLRELPFADEIPKCEDLRGVDLSGEDLTGVDFAFVHLDGARFHDSQLQRAYLSNTRLAGASFVNAQMTRANLTQVLADGAVFDGADLTSASLGTSRYRGASFRAAKLMGTDLGSSDLTGTDFRGAQTEGIDISGSDLSNAVWDGADGSIFGRWYAVTQTGLASTVPLDAVISGGSTTAVVRDVLTKIESAVAGSPERCFAFDSSGVATLTAAGRRYCAGRFSTPSIGELRARIQARPKAKPGRIHIVKLAGVHPLTDIGALQATAPEDTLFQVVAQFNALPNRGPIILPVHRYLSQSSQGARAAISTFPGALLRLYFAPFGSSDRFEQTDSGGLNLLENVFDNSVADLRAGYLSIANVHDRAGLAALLEERFERICVGMHDQLEVVFGFNWGGPVPRAPHHRIAQVFTSTIALGEHGPDRTWEEVTIARCLLRAAYLGTLLAAIDLRKRRVVLTLLGGGVYGNLQTEVAEAIRWAISEAEAYVDDRLTVIINTRSLGDLIPDEAARDSRGMPLTFESNLIANRHTLPDFDHIWQNSWTQLRAP